MPFQSGAFQLESVTEAGRVRAECGRGGVCADVLQRQRADADTDADNGRRDAGTGADSRRGRRDARRIQHARDAGTSQPLPHRSDAALRGHPLAVRGIHRARHSSLYTTSQS